MLMNFTHVLLKMTHQCQEMDTAYWEEARLRTESPPWPARMVAVHEKQVVYMYRNSVLLF